MKIEGKVFVITGGASGLGEATCRNLVSHGGRVAIFDRDEVKGQALAAELTGNAALFCNVDVQSEESVVTAVDAVMAKFGRIDGNVNCAGGGPSLSLVNKKGQPIDMKKFEFVVRLNLIGTMMVSSKCVAKMLEHDPDENDERGCVINVASVAAFDGQNGQGAYSAAKAGIVGMTLPMARDMGTRGVRINTIAPGVFATPLTSGMYDKDGKLGKVGAGLAAQQVFPNKRFGHPENFSHLVLAVFENEMINGETIRLDAGIRMPKL